MYYYCTCTKNNKRASHTGKYRRVKQVDGVCTNCGYYVISTRQYHHVQSGALRLYLMGTKDTKRGSKKC